MYTSMCRKDLGEYKRGQAFDTYRKEGSVYINIRPELTEEEYQKISKHDYAAHFNKIDENLNLRFRVKGTPKKVLWFTIQPPPPEDMPYWGMYFNFAGLNRKNLRLLQEKVYLSLLSINKVVISKETYSEIKSMLQTLERKCSIDYWEESTIAEVIEDYAKLLKTLIERAKKEDYQNLSTERELVK